jgi:hypothetical protein
MQLNSIFEVLQSLLVGISLGIASLESRARGDEHPIFIAFHNDRELILHKLSPLLVYHTLLAFSSPRAHELDCRLALARRQSQHVEHHVVQGVTIGYQALSSDKLIAEE